MYPQPDGNKKSLNIKALKTLRNNILIEDSRIVEVSNPKLEVIVAKETNATDSKNSSCSQNTNMQIKITLLTRMSKSAYTKYKFDARILFKNTSNFK